MTCPVAREPAPSPDAEADELAGPGLIVPDLAVPDAAVTQPRGRVSRPAAQLTRAR
jgi:hypothetical protein